MSEPESRHASPVTFSVLRTGPSGATYFSDELVALAPAVYVPGIPLVDVADPIAATAFTLSRCDAHYESDWHPAPRRQFVVVLEGGFEVTAGTQETRTFERGPFFLVEDVDGQGHQRRTIGEGPCLFATVACPAGGVT